VQKILANPRTRGELLLELNNALFSDLKYLSHLEDYRGMATCYTHYLEERSATYMKAEAGRDSQQLSLPVEAAEGGYAGVALDLIASLRGKGLRRLVLNVPNQGSIRGMEAEDVVEIPCQVSEGKIQPEPVGEIPGHCLGLMKQVKAYEKLTIAAACDGSYSKAVQALTIHPLVADYTTAKTLVDRYMERHGDFFPRLT
jgi:6-phospho-beta-glucosidase